MARPRGRVTGRRAKVAVGSAPGGERALSARRAVQRAPDAKAAAGPSRYQSAPAAQPDPQTIL